METTPGRGRPRSETARRAVLDAALLLCQTGGYQALTMKAIAETAGVGRQTVYRWWPTKQDVLIDALRDLRLRRSERLDPDSGDTLADLRTLLTATFALANSLTGKALTGLMADAQHDPGLSDRLQGTVIGPRRYALRLILARGVERGELDEAVPLDLAVDFAFGTMWYRLISHHAPADAELAEQITQALAALLRAGPRQPGQEVSDPAVVNTASELPTAG
ncbi:MAG: TetR/AcrR family transcriptional regulator [Streptomyces sp.]|nr:TetR/AcrR family transcriptional regulator [Streptomyces sp.]